MLPPIVNCLRKQPQYRNANGFSIVIFHRVREESPTQATEDSKNLPEREYGMRSGGYDLKLGGYDMGAGGYDLKAEGFIDFRN